MSLSRGGDQAVVKNRVSFEFFGGRSKEVEKRTKVKSRVVATSLSRIIIDSSSVFVMGHAWSDIDSLGAAAGVVAIARKCGKQAYIVINEQQTMAEPLLQKLKESEAYAGVFIDEQTALLYSDNKSILVVVDCNRPEIVESAGLLRSMQRVVVIDHHRRAANYIETAVLVMHEPYASSASELVCELIQYICSPGDLLRCEAEAMMAGIVLDTKGFTMHTGMRTFEAAAFLRGAGADPIEIKRLFQSDMQSSMERYEIITNAQIVRESIAVAAVDRAADRVIAAQAADEMLSIIGIDASFVLFQSATGTDISGRSLDTINVQMILEKLGGGGHQNIAGAQLKDMPVTKALDLLVAAIDLYFEENVFSSQ
jgi:c-di-AMP phosphodiesterase-like protein